MAKYDVTIVGGGIVGAAVALKLKQERSQFSILLLEKETLPAQHQTGRNSGVIHAGVYYQPGSLKAKYSREGLERTISFCQQYDVDYLQCGKLLVATNDLELQRMESLYERCQQNDLTPELLSKAQLNEREPNIAGEGGFFVKQTGIVDYVGMTKSLLAQFAALGGEIRYHFEVSGIEQSDSAICLRHTSGDAVETEFMVNCAGVYSDKLIKMMELDTDFSIVPFKGEYFLLPAKYNDIVKHLIYPIPDPDLPFLGVHLTRMIDGTVTVGPNAVLAAGKEAYGKWDVNLKDVLAMAGDSGLRKMIRSNFRSGMQEFKNSVYKRGYLQQVQKYCPQIQLEDLLYYRPGIRAQAVSNEGQLVHDFKFVESERSLHVGNAPSPAATSALPIADAIFEKITNKL
ncbi:MAG: L-2-hydroxyglutarate oxidase [Alteromonadaceae bacterium]|nr:L-2-hydroxyglutarate oxidase [Alteromonadaceae bacterium]